MSFLCLAVEQMHRYFLQHTHRLLWQRDGEVTAGHNNTQTHTDTDSLLKQFCSSYQLLSIDGESCRRTEGRTLAGFLCALYECVMSIQTANALKSSSVHGARQFVFLRDKSKVSLKQLLYICSELLLLNLKGTISKFFVHRLSNKLYSSMLDTNSEC